MKGWRRNIPPNLFPLFLVLFSHACLHSAVTAFQTCSRNDLRPFRPEITDSMGLECSQLNILMLMSQSL
uniref:Secreted protein n=1 Tax=Anguilla anguilla TaxID=7936 RepID=A0A0E9TZ42_ANGAN